jgi:phosphoenolpyruvate-protein phosphotransferase
MTHEISTPEQFVFSCSLSSGLHARPASQLAEVANKFAAQSVLTNLRNGLFANLKSVLAVIAADVRHGDQCVIRIQGSDEQSAHASLRRFVEETLPKCDTPLPLTEAVARHTTPPRVLQAAGVECSFGSPVSRGIAQGKVVIMNGALLPPSSGTITASDSQLELQRIKDAIAGVHKRIQEKLAHQISPDGAAVLQAELAMVRDVFLAEKLTEQVAMGKTANQAVLETGEFFTDLLGHSESDYIRERASDIEEICLQLLDEIRGGDPRTVAELREPSVVVAEMLAPQQFLALDRRWLKALVLEHSTTTSHTVILARSQGIPALVGVKNARLTLLPGREVVVDANRGFVIPQMSSPVQRFYERERKTLDQRQDVLHNVTGPTSTADGKKIEVAANASSPEELARARENGADGIGLFRTEILLLGRDDAPSEEEQFAIYSEAGRSCAGRTAIIRTFDIGGDKAVPYLNLPPEDNPFLGYRGVRIYADHPDLVQSQLRAILRASSLGNLQIMAPMISSLEEVVQFKAAITQAKRDLTHKDIAFNQNIRVGIMVEVPSTAFLLDQLCAEVDFLSIGTNDLSQYFFAADRGNSKVTALADVRHPAFLSLLKNIVSQIHQAGKWVGMCGEMASDIRNLPLLVGLGLDEISLPAAEIPVVKARISALHVPDCEQLLNRAIVCGTPKEVDNLLEGAQAFKTTQPLLSEELVLLGSTSQNKEEVIQEIVDAFYVVGRADNRHQLEEALWAREDVYSTGLGYGFATPHCKTEAVSTDSICVLKLNQPINWGSVDSEPVRMIVSIVMRGLHNSDSHLQVFSILARQLMNEEFRDRLFHAETAPDVVSYLAQQLGV